MRFLIMTDIEGVTGVTTYPQAEHGELGRRMLMHDLLAVIEGIRRHGPHEIVVYDMHTDGRNIDLAQLPADIPVVMGKPILPQRYRGVRGRLDGLFLLGLHAMQHVPDALLAHSYLREYDQIFLNDLLVGEIGVEAALAGAQGIPLVFVSGDDLGCAEAEALVPGVRTAVVKHSLGDAQALCHPPAHTHALLAEAARSAAAGAQSIEPFRLAGPYEIRIHFSDCAYLETMRALHPGLFTEPCVARVAGEALLPTWSKYLLMEREMIAACAT